MSKRHSVLRVVSGLALAIAVTQGSAVAQVPPEKDAGWQSDVSGLRHFTGLRCPDTIGAFSRIKVMEGDAVSQASCIYTGRDGITAVLRKHTQGTGRREALTFSRSYKAAGFEPITLSGAASTGISFRTRNWTPTSLCETLWYFSGTDADYTLWLSYTLPTQEAEVGPAIEVFTSALADQN
ncbi:hypothetical protein K1718_10980 [Roseibium porphyridii]|uniref:DUF3558 domain-containing protein n=1 Tax=Roseibium porphyridii TaxID=2866279 RepID=A0ABY8F8N1_9HYPH|nr:hypothetical protein [Roseibium sp. KMA01]WFE91855.1 hypothetical protein K1718_10980 [Roseibium sp. KMA01]